MPLVAKERILYTCQKCGHEEPKWLGRCPSCGAWNTLLESAPARERRKAAPAGTSVPLSAIEVSDTARLRTGLEEMDRVLGGGLMQGSAVLVGGEPGIGKSTLMLQLASGLEGGARVLYVSGEESAAQLRLRADRLGVTRDRVEVLCETGLEPIREAMARLRPALTIVDSVQTLASAEASSPPGTVTQIRLCAQELANAVKATGSSLCLVGHVTKEGLIAGPKVVEHLVDTVLYFDQSDSDLRFLRCSKNRFGSTEEVGIFRMTEKGLLAVADPASLFLEHRQGAPPAGVAVSPVFEGSRVLLVELQSLMVAAKGGLSRVFSDRIDGRRVSRIAAVLEKHLKVPLSSEDIYVNVAGGLRIAEVGIDLALALSLYGSRTGLALPAGLAVLGEVSLAGEVRRVPQLERRIRTALDMGFGRVIGPVPAEGPAPAGYEPAASVAEAVRLAWGAASRA
jgi:DNA repair protein RadA/Sms